MYSIFSVVTAVKLSSAMQQHCYPLYFHFFISQMFSWHVYIVFSSQVSFNICTNNNSFNLFIWTVKITYLDHFFTESEPSQSQWSVAVHIKLCWHEIRLWNRPVVPLPVVRILGLAARLNFDFIPGLRTDFIHIV